ncbi:unnamed protein product [Wuchereria bancrofti]|uniref:Uncharacterized protein n=1 Tax=Wuchereria bancrofti TaxID=6293 RepID=A0A3P7DBY0_WUCBA|nr:unnamed protein product [Wuchereria bancrofti]
MTIAKFAELSVTGRGSEPSIEEQLTLPSSTAPAINVDNTSPNKGIHAPRVDHTRRFLSLTAVLPHETTCTVREVTRAYTSVLVGCLLRY